MDEIKTIYIAGPYRSDTIAGTKANIDRAWAAAAKFVKAGFGVICPHTNTGHMDGLNSDEYFLDMTLDLMRMCDAVHVLDGWEGSEGTLAEIAEAERMGMLFADISPHDASLVEFYKKPPRLHGGYPGLDYMSFINEAYGPYNASAEVKE